MDDDKYVAAQRQITDQQLEIERLKAVLEIQSKSVSLATGLAAIFVLGPSLSRSIRDWFAAYQNENRLPKSESVDLVAALARRLTAIGVVGVLLAAIPVLLLFQQNRLIAVQTERIENQNQLIEAQRRASLVFELTSILDAIDDEIDGLGYETTAFRAERDDRNIEEFTKEERARFQRRGTPRSERPKFQLSERLAGRIIALSRSLRPYRFLSDSGSIVGRPLSPERGQLLVSLLDSGVGLEELNHESRLHFGDADLLGASLVEADLTHIDLQRARLDEASLESAVLNYANLTGSDMAEANVRYAKLNSATLRDTNLFAADLSGTCFEGANLTDVDLRCSNLCGTRWRGASLKRVKLQSAFGIPEELRGQGDTQVTNAEDLVCPVEYPTCQQVAPTEGCWDSN